MASKVFYHLGAFEESLNYALGAGDLFNVNDNSEYVETIIGNYLLSDNVFNLADVFLALMDIAFLLTLIWCY